MANHKHLKIFKKGIPSWNEWRRRKQKARGGLNEALGISGEDLDLSNEDLSEINQDLSNADLRRVNLSGSGFGGVNLEGALLDWANLRGAYLCGTSLRRTSLWYTDFSHAQFAWTSEIEHNLFPNETDLTDSAVGRSFFVNVDLSKVLGLSTIEHLAPSSIGIDTIYRSRGCIPEVFLRGAGVPEPFIANIKSLSPAMSHIEFYSCFISYSSNDTEFAGRLHADLQSKGVRCWFAPEDLKIGDKLRPSFDEAIHVHDKLMVVLSKSSINSSWVEKEVEAAFEKERQQNRTVLFPIRLDDAVMETSQAWAADIRRTRHIGDFREWKNHDSYRKAFERLLRDLRSEAKIASAAQR